MSGRMTRSHPAPNVIVHLEVADGRLDDRSGSLFHGDVDVLAPARLISVVQSNESARCCLQTGEVCALISAGAKRKPGRARPSTWAMPPAAQQTRSPPRQPARGPVLPNGVTET